MTHPVHAIGAQQPLAEAHRLMNAHGVRHLPVRSGGQLVGLVSQRDLHLIETLRDVDPEGVAVEEAMTQDLFSVEADVPLQQVVHEMAARKLGSALVLEDGELVGIFTTVDALHALEQLCARPAPARRRSPRASATRRER
ncbi:CBS domain-containing protein [Aggregicoccus sp. 17bor-14]|nr:CBS domain-containing protein [Simulacricoccus sp. 17bor-14]MRI91473.1 CBS domain-containing protein [Aggregicoccus sp. 17bor-14]